MQDRFVEDVVAVLPNLKRFALSLCRKPDVAEDLVQITAERALRARDRFDPSTRLEAWLFRILRNAWIDMVRRDATRARWSISTTHRWPIRWTASRRPMTG